LTVFRSLLLATFLFGLNVGSATAASFDCDKANTETEIAICDDPMLSALDELMAVAYKRAKQLNTVFLTENTHRVSFMSASQIRMRQREVITKLKDCSGEFNCIENLQLNRIKELSEKYMVLNANASFITSEFDYQNDTRIPAQGVEHFFGVIVGNSMAFQLEGIYRNLNQCNLAGIAVRRASNWEYKDEQCIGRIVVDSDGIRFVDEGGCQASCGVSGSIEQRHDF
jgi:uncharacterized protein